MKKILVVSEVPTHPTNAGHRACILAYTNLLKEIGYEVFFLYSNNEMLPKEYLNETKKFWGDHFFCFKKSFLVFAMRFLFSKLFLLLKQDISILDTHYPFGLSSYVKSLHNKFHFDCVIVNYVWLSRLMVDTSIPIKAVFTHDVFSNRNQRTNSKWDSLSPSQEAKALKRCPNILSIQENESVFFSYLAPESKIYTVFSPVKYIETPIVANQNILFLSSNNKHNLEGISFFIENIFPELQVKFPDVKLLIGGAICSVLQDKYISQQIEYFGFVDNVSEFYSLGNVCINPVSSGSGLKIKTFESLSYGKLTIVHPHSLEGVFSSSQIPVCVAESVGEYVTILLKLFTDTSFFVENKMKCCTYIEKYTEHIKEQYRLLIDN